MKLPPIADSHWETPDRCPRCKGKVRTIDCFFVFPHSGLKVILKDEFPGFDFIECEKGARCWSAWIPDRTTVAGELIAQSIYDAKNRRGIRYVWDRIMNWHGWARVQHRHHQWAAERRGLRLEWA